MKANVGKKLSGLSAALAGICIFMSPLAFGQTGVTVQSLTTIGTGSFQGAGTGTNSSAPEIGRLEHDRDFHLVRGFLSAGPTLTPPNPPSLGYVASVAGNLGFIGLSHIDQRLAGTGAYADSQFSLEPPDQAFCVGNGYAVEGVNTAMRVFSASTGATLTPIIALSQFFRLKPEINRTTMTYGDFISDPKCLYDGPTGRFFLTLLQADLDPVSGNFTGPTSVLIAVSQTSNPTGAWNLFKLNTTDDGSGGTPSNPNCPCLGDQPLIGLNEDGFYVTTNEFPQFVNGFNGSQIYAIAKGGLENPISGPANVVHINAGSLSAPDGGTWYTIQPATAPPNAPAPAAALKNTEFFLSALDFYATLDNRIAAWALTNTAALASANPAAVQLTSTVISSEVYGQPPPARQKSGPGTYQPELLNTNDDRMNQVVFANGHLYSGVNTILGSGSNTRAGIAYFVVTPSVVNHHVSATIAYQGYVSSGDQDVLFPSLGANNVGKAVISFTLAGPEHYPSAAYVSMDVGGQLGPVVVSKAGVAPEDGVSGPADGGVARWGDYSASYADENGDIWVATECIPSTARTALANWGTYITRVIP